MRDTGFTLIEVLVVIAVISILASIVSPLVFHHVDDAKISAARAQVEIFALALDAYRLDVGAYPTTEEGLAALRAAPEGDAALRWRGPYLRREEPPDPWDRPYIYVSPGEVNPASYDLMSRGADGVPGGEGDDADIESWR